MHFDEAVQYLLSLGHETLAIKLGLRNTELLLAELGNPEKSYPAVQIAGTNGKGSTAVVLDEICKVAGIRKGLYTSPHLSSITERIKIGGREISQTEFARYATAVRDASERLVRLDKIGAAPTFFEQVTAIALLAFREERVELAILETGLGGRLDATSVARAQIIGITPIDFDHQEYLGETIESIAAEKAAVIHSGATVVVSPQPAQALDVIRAQCARVQVQPSISDWKAHVESTSPEGKLRVTFETAQATYKEVTLGLLGRHQVTNTAMAIRLAESLPSLGFTIPRSAIIEGITNAKHPGRLELWEGQPSFLFDGAHNPSGTRALQDYLKEFIEVPVTLVFGAMRDKNLDLMAANVFPIAKRLVITQPNNPRAAKIETLAALATLHVDRKRITAANSVAEAIEAAIAVTPPTGLICFSGSLYLVGEAQTLIRQARDKHGFSRETTTSSR